MSETIFTSNERKSLEALARRRGFKSLRGYVRTLVQQDAEQHGETAAIESDEDLGDPAESFKRGWEQAIRGEVLTEDQFWKAVADPET